MSYISDPLSTPEVYFYLFECTYILEDDIDFQELDSMLAEVQINLDRNPTFAGAARDFQLELDEFDEESKNAEVIVSFVVRLWEDDENELQLIITSITEELEGIGLQVEETSFVGVGKRGNFY